ncbi:hypothetical protein FC56_GL000309 [Lentilactobacillus senioris DSM 24302 = JCM 17472]|uniref:Uncharacterized protein n=1 Tax=Lentilactobacillus senioris DSM 24302 = JCM 17472 TaxID=1423802 RepID=A0A0R2CZP2_9LACO|nr:hypothetical protein [Lentilactobacillus senioris]KRM93593.1 hypothetical protein FC56_GL000309 [Lentilactobacillus senioris DSM 24302 = JCM 17472]
MAKYNKSFEEMSKAFSDFSSEYENDLLKQLADMGFSLDDEIYFNTPIEHNKNKITEDDDSIFVVEDSLNFPTSNIIYTDNILAA